MLIFSLLFAHSAELTINANYIELEVWYCEPLIDPLIIIA
jgi:hypothetical protein